MTNPQLSHLTDAQIVKASTKFAKIGRWLFLVTMAFFTMGVWVDGRWLLMSLMVAGLMGFAFAISMATVQEYKDRNPDFKRPEAS